MGTPTREQCPNCERRLVVRAGDEIKEYFADHDIPEKYIIKKKQFEAICCNCGCNITRHYDVD
jgi:hypothetical protein